MNKEYYMRVVRAEVCQKELDEILKNIYGNDVGLKYNFYYPDIFIDVCMKKLNNEIDYEYFKTWLIVVCNLLCVDEKHYDISYCLDGWTFADDYGERICREIIADIKDYDLQFKHKQYIKYHKKNKMKVIYLRFEMVDHSTDTVIYKCYIVDYAKKTYDLRFVDEEMLDFDLEKNYCFIIDEEHYYDIKKQEAKRTVVDCSKPEKQHCEAEEELHYLFLDNNFSRDKTLQL